MTKLDLKALVDQTDFTAEWLVSVLEEHNDKFKKARGNSNIVAITTNDISAGKGYASKVLKTCVQFDDPMKTQYTFIMKIPCEDFALKLFGLDFDEVKRKEFLAKILVVHNVECDAYNLLKDIRDFPLAEIYYSLKGDEHTNGVIIMEDLSVGYITMGIFQSVTAEHCLAVAKHFADFQVYVESLSRDKWHGKFQECIYMRKDLNDSDRQCLPPAMEYNNGELKDQLKFYADIDWYKLSCYVVRDRAEEYDALTLCHGDAWTNNMLIKLNNDGSVSNTIGAFVDWQLLFEGTPLHDISRLIITCADADIRREVESKAVDLFYDRLSEKLKANNQKIRFTRAQAHELYELSCIQQIQLLIKVFTYLALPLEKTGHSWDKAKCAKIWLRLKMAMEDAESIIEKYDLRKMFAC